MLSADGSVNLTIHPRCRRLITAFQCYARARRSGQWMDYAEDPQHPHEDLIDPLAGGLKVEFPEGRTPPASVPDNSCSRTFERFAMRYSWFDLVLYLFALVLLIPLVMRLVESIWARSDAFN